MKSWHNGGLAIWQFVEYDMAINAKKLAVEIKQTPVQGFHPE